jgi:hypothetical protein
MKPVRGRARRPRPAATPAAAILAAAFLAGAAMTHAAGTSLVPGADISDCRSALRTGITSCAASADPPADAPAAAALAPPPGPAASAGSTPPTAGVTEAQIDAYLADFGKPPREAVRALLDPTDEHILGLLRKQNETASVAAFVAARMTELQQRYRIDPPGPWHPVPPDLPAMLQMRVTLFCAPDDEPSRAAAQVLAALADRFPSLQARVALVGTLEGRRLAAAVARLGSALPVTVVDEDAVDGAFGDLPLPLLEITDLRDSRSWRLDAQGLSLERLRARIVALRAAAEGPRDVIAGAR